MGCPVRKVTKIGGGSSMMTEFDMTAALVRGMIAAGKIPITAKMRLGWDDDNLTAPDLSRVLEDAGANPSPRPACCTTPTVASNTPAASIAPARKPTAAWPR